MYKFIENLFLSGINVNIFPTCSRRLSFKLDDFIAKLFVNAKEFFGDLLLRHLTLIGKNMFCILRGALSFGVSPKSITHTHALTSAQQQHVGFINGVFVRNSEQIARY